MSFNEALIKERQLTWTLGRGNFSGATFLIARRLLLVPHVWIQEKSMEAPDTDLSPCLCLAGRFVSS